MHVLTLSTQDANFDVALAQRLAFDDSTDAGIQNAVTEIIAAVRARGDAEGAQHGADMGLGGVVAQAQLAG